jgi:hypothetical protein
VSLVRLRRGRVGRAPVSTSLQPLKLRALDRAFDRVGSGGSFADLGGVWAVEAGYTFHVLEHHAPVRAVLVDTGITPTVRQRAEKYPALRLLEQDFGTPEAAQEVGEVDVVALFDVLLHQASPDWDEVLGRYCRQAKAVVVVQPQWVGARTVRLLDLGREEYLANVPAEQIPVDFDALDEVHPRYGKPVRDIHEIWQWGITDDDLVGVATAHGLRPVYYEDVGQWGDLPAFAARAFVFLREP